jgi:hypothetical protein
VTDLESRVRSLEHNVLALARAVSDISTTHTLFAAAAVAHLNGISEDLKELRSALDDESDDGNDKWNDLW